MAALEVLDRLRSDGRPASAAEQAVLARWSGWGALPQVFDEDNDAHAQAREQARRLLGDEAGWAAARRTTLNAHYTPVEVAKAMWAAVEGLGFDGGRVLEPGCGSGTFLGLAPAGCELVGVEADPATATVARHLYGARAAIVAQRLEEYAAPEGHFDLVIGNVPFAKVTPHDPRHNRARLALHNYAIVKSLDVTRAGGLVVVLTSRYTADARNPAARREIDARADLIGALRFPAGAFAAAAGTDVVADLLVLRRRGGDAERRGMSWEAITTLPGDDDETGEAVYVNELFVARPDLVLGRLGVDRGLYRERDLTVMATGDLLPALEQALAGVVADAHRRDLAFKARPLAAVTSAAVVAATPAVPPFAQESSIVVVDGALGRIAAGRVLPFRPRYRSDEPELRRLVCLRGEARAVLATQVAGADDAEVAAAQVRLRAAYDTYTRAHGPLNRFRTARTGRIDPETGEEILRRIQPRMGGFRDDPDWPLVAALERFDDDTQVARPAAIFTQRIVSPPPLRLGVDTAAEAVAVCLDEAGRLDLDRIAELLGIDEASARAELAGLAFEDPSSGELVPASAYLSGNVRTKLATARAAVASESRYEANVAALDAVLPRQLQPDEITAGLGAPWVPPGDVEAFCADIFGAEVEVERLAAIGSWTVRLHSGGRGSVSLSSEWGTARADGIVLLDAGLNQRLHTVYDEDADGRRVRNDTETLAARDKQEAIAVRFSAWVWEEPERAARLAERYNELFRSVVVPSHDGSHLSLPGLAGTFSPHPHQRDAVARILTDGRALLAHAVGAGKTATVIMSIMEMRRLGLASKPAVVVPNHMLEQFSREWLQLYPTARLLIADRDRLSRERRKEFVARCATGDWDGVVFTHAGFGRIPLGRELYSRYLEENLERCRAALAESRAGKGLSVKRLERRLAQREETLRKLLAAEAKDDGVSWAETGVDHITCDEAHCFKNRHVDSAIDGIATPGSHRAQDLDAKLWALRGTHGPRVVTFATATPVANSIAELWTMQSYLQPDVLAEADLSAFDSWAATFARTVTALELSPDGSSYRMKTRFARFQNVPELITLYRQVADVRTAEDLALPVPALAGGRPETVVVPPSAALRTYVADLASRAEQVRSRSVMPEEDNMLKITGDGRRAALDLRLVGERPDPSGGKLAVAADRIASIHRSTAAHLFVDEGGRPHPRPGGLQLVFCDVSTPVGKGWNAYDELRGLLARRGVPAEAVRFVHEAATDEAKARLFAACRDGRVAVLIGSTDKMGVGTNVQARAVALHHLDCPWRPADIEQREGRIIRQGNQNPEVAILRYATEASFDIYMWQTVERKAAFINQVATGRAVEREVEDIGDQALSFAEVKALATGNPLILEKAGVDAEVARLSRLRRAHQDDQHRLRRALDTAERRAGSAAGRICQLESAIERRQETRGDRFKMTVDGVPHAKRLDAGDHLHRLVSSLMSGPSSLPAGAPIGHLAGFDVHGDVDRRLDELSVTIPRIGAEVRCPTDEWPTVDPSSFVQRLERRIQNLDSALTEARGDQAAAGREAERARARIGAPFEHESLLRGLQRRQQEIIEQLVLPAEEPASIPPELTDAQRIADRLASVPARSAPRSAPSL